MLIRNIASYLNMKAAASKLIRSDIIYPNYVFKRQYQKYHFLEAGVALNFDLLQAIGKFCDDTVVNLLHYNPSGEDFWFPRYGHYGVLSAVIGSTKEEWDSEINIHPVNDYTSLYSEEGQAIVFGTSEKWVIFCMYSFDLAVLATDIDLSRVKESNFVNYVHDVDWAVQYWKSIGAKLEPSFYNSMMKNYPKN